jgi:hypothetical protein
MTPTRYHVSVTEAAQDDLVTLWLNHPAERASITRASHRIDQTLRQDPDQKGVPTPMAGAASRRYFEDHPLAVYFDVSEPDHLVTIVAYDWLGQTP